MWSRKDSHSIVDKAVVDGKLTGAVDLAEVNITEMRLIRNRYLQENGHNMKGIGELGSSSESSNCSGFHNCRYGESSI